MTQHDDELRATRRRWRKLDDSPEVYGALASLFDGNAALLDYWQATYDLAKAYYEQFSSDDEAPADANWIDAMAESVSDDPNVLSWIVSKPGTSVQWWKIQTIGIGSMPAQVVHLTTDMTRGQVRRLLTAIGIEVRQ